jgi:hypothetical protein
MLAPHDQNSFSKFSFKTKSSAGATTVGGLKSHGSNLRLKRHA